MGWRTMALKYQKGIGSWWSEVKHNMRLPETTIGPICSCGIHDFPSLLLSLRLLELGFAGKHSYSSLAAYMLVLTSNTLHEANLHVGFGGLEVHMYSEHQTDSPLICSPMSLPRSQQTNGKMANEASFQSTSTAQYPQMTNEGERRSTHCLTSHPHVQNKK